MTIFGLLAAVFTIAAAGAGISLLSLAGRPRVNAAELCALSWLFGTGAISLLLWTFGMLVSGALLQTVVAAGAVGLAAAGVMRVRRCTTVLSIPKPRTLAEWLLVVVILTELTAVFYGSFSVTLGWDGLLNWEVKARYAFMHNGVIPSAYYRDESRAFTHPAYPLWIPMSELWLYLSMGEVNQFWAKVLFPLIYTSGAILLATVGARLTVRRWIGLAAAALLFFIPGLTNSPGGMHSGYVDVPISILYLGAIGYLLLSASRAEIADFRTYALFLALLPWAKREGAVLWLVAAICGALVIWRQRAQLPVRHCAAWLIPGAAVSLAWKAFVVAAGTPASTEFLPMNLGNLSENLFRVGPIARTVFHEMVETERWSIFWPIVAVALLWLLFRGRDLRLLILFIAVAAPISIYAGTYVFSAWPDWTAHVAASLSRLLLHVMPIAWVAIALALRPPTDRGLRPAPLKGNPTA